MKLTESQRRALREAKERKRGGVLADPRTITKLVELGLVEWHRDEYGPRPQITAAGRAAVA